jgi:hypothetical protein
MNRRGRSAFTPSPPSRGGLAAHADLMEENYRRREQQQRMMQQRMMQPPMMQERWPRPRAASNGLPRIQTGNFILPNRRFKIQMRDGEYPNSPYAENVHGIARRQMGAAADSHVQRTIFARQPEAVNWLNNPANLLDRPRSSRYNESARVYRTNLLQDLGQRYDDRATKYDLRRNSGY